MNKKIALFDTKPYDRNSFERINKEFGFEIIYFTTHLNNHTASLSENFDGVCAFVNDIIDTTVIKELVARKIEIIALRCAGYNNVDVVAAKNNIHVVRVPAYSPRGVAEHALALMLTLNRKTHKAYWRTRDGNFSINGLLGFDMHGKTAAVIGTGKIGKCLVEILQGLGMHILLYDPYPDTTFANAHKIDYVSLEELYSRADVISLHCPLTAETEYMIDTDAIKSMKQGVMIINTGRGKLIHTTALIEGLKSGIIGSAGLDVYEEESSYFFEDRSSEMISDDILARLLTFPNVLVTSHQAFFTTEALDNIARTTLTNFQEFFDKGLLTNEISYS